MGKRAIRASATTKRIQRILIVRALPGLGDLLCCVPALRSLRAAFPLAQIDLLGLPQMRWFADRFRAYIDGWVDFPGYPGIPEGWGGVRSLPSFFAKMQAHPYDLALQLHGSGDHINPFTLLLGASKAAGFYVPGEFCPDADWLPYPHHEPEVWRLLKLLTFLGIPVQTDEISFPIHSAERERCAQLMDKHELSAGRYICVHAGASTASRQWSTAGFAQVADRLADRGYGLVLTGTVAEKSVVDAVVSQMAHQSVNLTGSTDLGTLAALLEQAALTVCNDTGISHLAAALKAPSVVIFSDSEVNRWAPLDSDRHRVVDRRQVKHVAKAVMAAADKLLAREVAYAG
ncbi:MAG: glycosyltransferase family 9 protein [Phormidesmis sp.]